MLKEDVSVKPKLVKETNIIVGEWHLAHKKKEVLDVNFWVVKKIWKLSDS